MTMAPVVSLVMPSKGRDEICARSVRTALLAIGDLDAELILVNDSPGRDLSHLAAPKLTIVDNEGSGIAWARNTGVRRSKAPLLLFIDDDILTSRLAIDAHLAFHEEHARSALNLNWVYPPELDAAVRTTRFGRFLVNSGHTTLRGWFGEKGWQDDAVFEIPSVASYHMSIERSVFDEIGGYDPAFGSSGEDTDLCRDGRWGRGGVRFFLNTKVTVFHNEVDKTDVEAWLGRYHRSSQFRPTAIKNGHHHLALNQSWRRRLALRQIMRARKIILGALERLPELPGTDWLYARGISAVLAATIADGYYGAL